jgi:hypothetical protein
MDRISALIRILLLLTFTLKEPNFTSYADCRCQLSLRWLLTCSVLFCQMSLSTVITLIVAMLSIVLSNVVGLTVIKPSVVAPIHLQRIRWRGLSNPSYTGRCTHRWVHPRPKTSCWKVEVRGTIWIHWSQFLILREMVDFRKVNLPKMSAC